MMLQSGFKHPSDFLDMTPHRLKKAGCKSRFFLSAQSEVGDQRAVTLDIFLLKITEQPAALTYL